MIMGALRQIKRGMKSAGRVEVWDYPVIFWASRLRKDKTTDLDAGGHLGMKYTAFQKHLDLQDMDWTVYDLQAIVEAARTAQKMGLVASAISFEDKLARVQNCEVLLGSWLLPFLDNSFGDLIGALLKRPHMPVLNMVALREAPELVTLEQIGPARVPYRIRNWQAFEAEIETLGCEFLGRWSIPSLAPVIATRPSEGASEGWGFVLHEKRANGRKLSKSATGESLGSFLASERSPSPALAA